MALDTVAPLLARDLVPLKIDTDRMIGGQDMFAKYCPKNDGIPWYAILDAEGRTVVTSDLPGTGNIGFPTDEADYAHLRAMLQKAARRLTPADLDALVASVRARKPTTVP